MTLDDLYDKVLSDRDIMADFVKASGTNSLAAFADEYNCKATDAEIREYFISKCEGELDDDALDAVAGGTFDFGRWISDIFNSIFGGAGKTSGSGSAGKTTVGVSSENSNNAILGGRTVKVGGDVPLNSVVGKGYVPVSGDIPVSSVLKKL